MRLAEARRHPARRLLCAAALLLLPAGSLLADELDQLNALDQARFRLLAEDLAAMLAYRGVQAAEPYGTIGFDVAVVAGGVQLANEGAWTAAGADVSTLSQLGLAVTKGLPLGIDVGAFLATAPGAGLRSHGVQLRYALLEGGVKTPAVGLRAAATWLDGVGQLEASTRSLDLSVSRNFGALTPYLGYGRVWADVTPGAGTGLAGVDADGNRAFAGLRLSLLLLELGLEAERLHEATGYALKIGFAF